MSGSSNKLPWYRDGLAFECQSCGDCCRGPGGYVWVTEGEAETLAAALNQPFRDFCCNMLRNTLSGLALVDAGNGDCPLLEKGGGCRVYEARPVQCRTWPWWEENLYSRERWEDAATRCPGMNKGQIHSRLVIECEMAKVF